MAFSPRTIHITIIVSFYMSRSVKKGWIGGPIILMLDILLVEQKKLEFSPSLFSQDLNIPLIVEVLNDW